MTLTKRSEVYLRLGSHSEKQYVQKTFRLFSGVLVGANLLESTPGATVSFALNVLGESKAFAIDPMTYTFGMDLAFIKSETIDKDAKNKGDKKIGLKRSFAKLAEEFGDPILDAVLKNDRRVTPEDFKDDAQVAEFSESIYSYQIERMRTYFEADVQLQEFSEHCPDPSFVFAPYFYIPYGESHWHRWYEVDLRLSRAFVKIKGTIEKHGVICINQSVLDHEEDFLRICEKFLDTGAPAYWLWLSALNEEKIPAARLEVLAKAVLMFAEADRKLYNMHGGYLSALLSKQGLTGFSHGVGYGESKDVIPVIGVIVPVVNYHYPPLHVRMGIADIERALSDLEIFDADDFHKKVCDCTVCKGVLDGDLENLGQFGDFIRKKGNQRDSQTPDSAKKCRLHFLLARRKEIDRISNRTSEQLKVELGDLVAEYSALPAHLTMANRWKHLRTWSKAL